MASQFRISPSHALKLSINTENTNGDRTQINKYGDCGRRRQAERRKKNLKHAKIIYKFKFLQSVCDYTKRQRQQQQQEQQQ